MMRDGKHFVTQRVSLPAQFDGVAGELYSGAVFCKPGSVPPRYPPGAVPLVEREPG